MNQKSNKDKGLMISLIGILLVSSVYAYSAPLYSNAELKLKSGYTPDLYTNNILKFGEGEAAVQCNPTLNQDWTISDAQICDGKEVTTGTGQIYITTGGTLTLINGANVTTKTLNLETTGDQIFINGGSSIITI